MSGHDNESRISVIHLLWCVSIYSQLGEPDVMNQQVTHPLKLPKFLHTHYAQIMTHHTSQTCTIHRVYLALEFGESNSHRFAVLSVFMRIVEGHKFGLSKFESYLYTICHHICVIRVFLSIMQETNGQICRKYDLILRKF